MTKKMLIDASHPEETRVVVVNHSRVEELDFESQAKRQIRGNVYLARVTRVEPSLQAAFVEFGGNRHGFLAFSEIHPDYYQIPFEDRQALIEAEQAESLEQEARDMAAIDNKGTNGEIAECVDPFTPAATNHRTADKKLVRELDDPTAMASKNYKAADAEFEQMEAAIAALGLSSDSSDDDNDNDNDDDDDDDDAADDDDKEVAAEQKKMDRQRKKRMSRRRYKIQEVVKRGQILLVQAVKEERGNKGAALTTYMSLAGRYCVLMPNTPRGGGISRKIANGGDRKRLKSIMSELEVPKGMGVIVRTAGAKRSKTEIERDYDYLAKLWDTIRDTTMNSVAPALIHQEGDLVKRSLRDLYNKDIEEVLVQGEGAFNDAKAFITMLMPSHAENIKLYTDEIPLFLRYQVEEQIENSLDPVAQLPSGGYLVIHPTEALVSVDVNSGRSTKERNVERTALKTNLEAADEVARQMRLRDLAGLVVIDFIDMDENRNNRAVEKRMKDALSRDRARVQMARISQFGLMEISRQRRRRSLLEGSSASCEHCGGVGRKRSVESSALKAIRAIEEEGIRGKASRIRLRVSPNVALYLFNEKRDLLQHVDKEFNLFTELVSDENLHRPDFEIERVELRENSGADPLDALEKAAKKALKNRPARKPRQENSEREDDNGNEDRNDRGGRSKNNNRRRRGKRNDRNQNSDNATEDNSETPKVEAAEGARDGEGETRKRRRRRGRRGGRGKRSGENRNNEANGNEAQNADSEVKPSEAKASDTPKSDGQDTPKPRRNRRKGSKADSSNNESREAKAETAPENAPKPRRTRKPAPQKGKTDSAADTSAPESAKSESSKSPKSDDAPKPKRTRRKAPVKAASATADVKTEAPKAKKPAAKRTRKAAPAPAKPKAKPAAADTPKPKKAAKAPAKKPAPKAKAEPKAKPAPKPAPVKAASPAPAKVEKPAPAPASAKAEKKDKKGWWSKRNPFA